MKKLLVLPLAALLLLALLLAGCQQVMVSDEPEAAQDETTGGETPPAEEVDGEVAEDAVCALALVTDYTGIADGAFSQAVWEGLQQYAEEHELQAQYFQPTESSNSAYLAAITAAAEAGAQLIVCPGYQFADAVYQAQYLYPEICFVAVDCSPVSTASGEAKQEENVYSIFYREEQAGFLAGYAAVMDGYTKIGFLGGMSLPSVVRFGTGFVQGADHAAQQQGVQVELRYDYCGLFTDDPLVETQASAWYINGTQLIFACGGEFYRSVARAAEAAGTVMIGVDVDQSKDSPTIITSAVKSLSASVYDAVDAYYRGEFPGGSTVNLGVAEGGVGLAMDTARFQSFDSESYAQILQQLADEQILVRAVSDVAVPLDTLVSDRVTILYEED